MIICWWCSEKCERQNLLHAPTSSKKPWRLVGNFCGVACTKSYLVSKELSVSNLKLMLKKEYGIPTSCELPCAPPWQMLQKYGPPFGKMSVAEFRVNDWTVEKLRFQDKEMHLLKSNRVVVIKHRVPAAKKASSIQSHTAMPMRRKTKVRRNGIMSYMKPAS